MNKPKGALKNTVGTDVCNKDTSPTTQTFQPELENQLLFLLKTIQKQTSCSNCGVFNFEKRESVLNPFLLLNKSKSFSEKIKVSWKKIGNEIVVDGKPKVITDKEVFHFVPLKINDELFGLLVNSFHQSDEKSLSEKIDLTIRWADIIRLVFESLNKNKEIKQTQLILETLNQELSKLNQLKALKEIADGVAHDINNPLQVILGKTQILLMKTSSASLPGQGGGSTFSGNHPDGQKLTSELGIIEKNANRISALVTELSNFIKSTQSDVESKSDVSLNYLLNHTLSIVKNRFKAQGIELNFQTEEDLPSICGNFFSLQQAFLDLMLNAQEAMPQGGKFSVQLHKKDNFVELQFQDTGEKIPEHLLPQIFDPFLIHPELKRKIGWGLHSTYQIIQKHRGEIEVKNKEDEGIIFSIKLPLV